MSYQQEIYHIGAGFRERTFLIREKGDKKRRRESKNRRTELRRRSKKKDKGKLEKIRRETRSEVSLKVAK